MSRHQPSPAAKRAHHKRWLDAGNKRFAVRLSHEANIALELMSARNGLSKSKMIERLICNAPLLAPQSADEATLSVMREHGMSHVEAVAFQALMETVDICDDRR